MSGMISLSSTNAEQLSPRLGRWCRIFNIPLPFAVPEARLNPKSGLHVLCRFIATGWLLPV